MSSVAEATEDMVTRLTAPFNVAAATARVQLDSLKVRVLYSMHILDQGDVIMIFLVHYFVGTSSKVTSHAVLTTEGSTLQGPAKKWKRPIVSKSKEEKKFLTSEHKCFICEQPGHIAPNYPQRKRPADSEDKEDRKGKKPMAGLVPDMVGDKPNSDASELCKAWGKGIMDAYNKKIIVQSRGKTHILDVKLKGDPIPTVSAFSITFLMKKHLSADLVFACKVSDCDESNLSVLDKERLVFLQQFSDCFSDSLISQLPPERPEDHAIDLVPDSSPPNRPPYYYRRFIRSFVEIASPLHALQKKGITFRWTQKEISTFNLLKEKMTLDPLIVLPDLRKSFVIQCDACGSSIGAVLMQDGKIVHVEGKKNVVADALSRKPQISPVSIPYHHELDDVKEQYANDEDLARIFEQLMDGQGHEHYLLKDGFMMMHGRLCATRPLRHKVIEESHVPPYAGHRGIDATVKAVVTLFYWPTLRGDVDAFVQACIIYQKVKFDRQKAPALLQPLPIPDKPWESIAMDFIFDLLRTQTDMLVYGPSFADSASRLILFLSGRR
ncbi:hypothetical protein L7F22_046079 [Adiantum nelumboides]|nr:hypothetical protein [Adiantum nelumboides]